jgi:hypothetical protein
MGNRFCQRPGPPVSRSVPTHPLTRTCSLPARYPPLLAPPSFAYSVANLGVRVLICSGGRKCSQSTLVGWASWQVACHFGSAFSLYLGIFIQETATTTNFQIFSSRIARNHSKSFDLPSPPAPMPPVPPALVLLRPHTHNVLDTQRTFPGTRISSFRAKNHQNRPESTSFACRRPGGAPCLLVHFSSLFLLLSTRYSYADALIKFQPTGRSGNTTLNRSFVLSFVRSRSHSPPLEYRQQVIRNTWKTSDPHRSASFTPNNCQDRPQ